MMDSPTVESHGVNDDVPAEFIKQAIHDLVSVSQENLIGTNKELSQT